MDKLEGVDRLLKICLFEVFDFMMIIKDCTGERRGDPGLAEKRVSCIVFFNNKMHCLIIESLCTVRYFGVPV